MSNLDGAVPGTVHDRPTFHDFLVDFGTFVVLSLDPVASVAALKDERTTELAAQIPRVKYLALVRNSVNDALTWPMPPRQPPLALLFYLVAQQRPQSSAYVALFSPHSHPTGRSSIIPEPPVPWPELYAYTTGGIDARITRIHTDNPLLSKLTSDQMLEIIKASRVDRAALTLARQGEATTPATNGETAATSNGAIPTSSAVPAATPEIDQDQPDTQEPQDETRVTDQIDILLGADESLSSHSDSSSSDSSSSAGSNDGGTEPLAMRLHAEVWLDVTAVTEFDDPAEYPVFLSQLREVEEEWKARGIKEILADQPRTREWAQGVANAVATPPEELESSAVERVSSPPLDAPAEAERGEVDTAVDQAPAQEPAEAPTKKRNLLIKLLSRVVEVPRQFIAKLIAILPLQRKSKPHPPPETSPPAP